jgi:DNA-binding IclR family transcriptional regulator
MKKIKTTYSVPAVDRMLDIIEFLSSNKTPSGITELSKALKINTNPIFRIMKRLVERGYVEIEASSGKYQLSTKFFTIGMSLYTRFELRQRARKHLEWLSGESGETAQIHIPDGDQMLVLDSVVPHASYFLQVVPGSRVYYHNNAFGKTILAFKDEKEIRALLPKNLPALTKNTLTDLNVLISQLQNVRKTGIAFDVEEYINGIFCIGAPVFDIEGKAVAGLGITALTSRYHNSDNKKIIRAVLETAQKVSSETGYEGDYFKKLLFQA